MTNPRQSLGSGACDRTFSGRLVAALALAVAASVVLSVGEFQPSTLGVTVKAPGQGRYSPSDPAALTPVARRLERILLTANDGDSTAATSQAADVADPAVKEHSSSLLAVLGEKHLKCETALRQCKENLDSERSRTVVGGTGDSAEDDTNKKDKLMAALLRENKKLKQQLQYLRLSTSSAPRPPKELLSGAEGEGTTASLEGDNLSLAAEMAGTAKPQAESVSQAGSNAGGIPGLSSALEKESLEAARKVLEECGTKQAAPQAQPGDRAYACEATEEDLKQYFNYTPRAECPDDWFFVQKLVYIKSCFCLPKRNCFAPAPSNYREPTIPFPQSLFDPKALSNDNVRWTKMYWPSYEALNSRVVGDCRDCFNVVLEDTRWEVNFMGAIPMRQVLSLKGKGAIKIGLDAGGGTGSFAAKMAQHGVTIVTTAMNTETLAGEKEGGLPYMETIAQRGLVPLFVPHKVRQPFFDGTLDIVHNINSIKYFTIPEFEELLFEWDRILRPGGVMWFELFYAPVSEMPLYITVIEMFGYSKLYWNMTRKVDAAERNDLPHVYLNCVLEKPRRPENAPPLKPGSTSSLTVA